MKKKLDVILKLNLRPLKLKLDKNHRNSTNQRNSAAVLPTADCAKIFSVQRYLISSLWLQIYKQ